MRVSLPGYARLLYTENNVQELCQVHSIAEKEAAGVLYCVLSAGYTKILDIRSRTSIICNLFTFEQSPAEMFVAPLLSCGIDSILASMSMNG